jgi:hypothetical protein
LKGDSSRSEQLEPFHNTDEVCRASIGLDAVGVSATRRQDLSSSLFDWFRSVSKKENLFVIVYVF